MRRGSLRRRAAVVALVVVVGGSVAGYLVHQRMAPAASLQQVTVRVQRGTVARQVSASGTVEPSQEVDANFLVSGTITEVDVKAGDQVHKGQVLAKVDPASLQQALQQAQSQLAADQVQAEITATRDQQTLGGLQNQYNQDGCLNSGLSTAQRRQCAGDEGQIELQQLTDQHDQDLSQATVAKDESGVQTAQQNLDDATLTSPIDGVVMTDNATVGASVAAGSPGTSSTSPSASSSSSSSSSSSDPSSSALFVVADTSSYEVTASFPEADVVQLQANQAATASLPGVSGAALTGTVASISDQGTTNNGLTTYPVVVSLTASDPSLRPGMTADLVVITAEATNVLMVPNQALTSGPSGPSLEVVGRDGKTRLTPVKTGLQGDAMTEIQGGVQAGEKVSVPSGSGRVPNLGGGKGGGLFVPVAVMQPRWPA